MFMVMSRFGAVLAVAGCLAGLVCGARAQPVSLTEDAKLQGSDTAFAGGSSFGWDSAISGDHAIVGAFTSDEQGDQSGSAYIYRRDQGGAGSWGEVVKLTAFDAQAGDHFGQSVWIEGDTAFVGSPDDDDACVNEPFCQSGAVYVYQRNQGGANNWGLVRKVQPSVLLPGIQFGASVAMNGDTLIVGALGLTAGSAYVFERNQGGADQWGQTAIIHSSDSNGADGFGISVGIDGDVAIVGAVNGFKGNPTGAAYIFGRNQNGPNQWGQVRRLLASDAANGDQFGISVAVRSGSAIVGAPEADGPGVFRGAAYVYGQDVGGAGNWGQVVKLNSPDFRNAIFGYSVAIDQGMAVVGDWRYDRGVAAVDSGAAYIYERDLGGPGNWGVGYRLSPEGIDAFVGGDYFGRSVGVDNGRVIGGAHGTNELGSFTGSAYVFEVEAVCVPDLNGDGELNFFDVSLFLTLFAAMDPTVDFNHDGQFNFFDVSLFLQAYLAGCP